MGREGRGIRRGREDVGGNGREAGTYTWVHPEGENSKGLGRTFLSEWAHKSIYREVPLYHQGLATVMIPQKSPMRTCTISEIQCTCF